MTRAAATAALLVLAAPSAHAQWGYGGFGYGYRGGFGFGGPNFAFGAAWGGYSYGYAGPVYGYAPWGWAPSPAYVVLQPTVVVQPTIVVQPAVGFAGGFGDRLAGVERVPDNYRVQPVEFKVNDAVRRGDLLAVRPRKEEPKGNGFAPGGGEVPLRLPGAVVPNDPAGRAAFEVDRGRRAFAAEEYGRAAERFAAAAAADPKGPLPAFLLAQARTARGEYAEAVAALREGLARAPEWPASGFRVKELYGANPERFDAQLAELRAAAAANPNDPTVGFLLGYHLWFLGDRAEAVKVFRRAAGQAKDPAVIERFLLEADRKL